ncbi:MAG: chitobiase/beta-hexosaminidase C-terminal domain-containing protein, partial [Planctomycetota bacterium]|nr:chitobiase/beta-hexosaminidase C-terminal domain-containing protein [Planctomycetota bacterium]
NTYQEEIDWMKGWLRDRLEWIDSTFLPPPTFNQDGGLIDPGFELSMNTRSGTIYYTTDGSDPRLAGGDISASAQVFGSAAGLPLVSSAVSTEVRVLVPANGVLGRSWTQPGFNHAGWRRGSAGIGVGYERGSGYETHIDVDVRGQMDGVNTSVYLRLPFQLADPGEVQSLSLRMRYDDGFVAYLNGVEIARANAPATPSWNAAATGLHDDGAAVVFEGFEVSQHLGDLLAGDNVLAIHGLNESLTSSDMLVEPTLSGSTSLVAEAVVLTEPTHVIARTFNDGEWSGPSEATFVLESDLPIRITEIMYHPRELPEGSPFRRRDIEFIELQNVGSVPVDLSGVRFIEGVFFNFAKGSVKRLLPGEFVLVVRSLPGFEWYYGSEGMNIAGEFLGALDNAGDLLHLIDGTGESIHRFFYDDAWYPETDGAGHSLVSLDPLADPLTWGDAASWAPSGAVDGSPGFEDSAEPPLLVRGFRLPGDANEDGILDISDAVALLRLLFGGGPGPESLPCAGETPGDGGNLAVLDQNGDAVVDLSDAVHVLNYLFLSGSAPVLGTDCVRVAGCSDACVN